MANKLGKPETGGEERQPDRAEQEPTEDEFAHGLASASAVPWPVDSYLDRVARECLEYKRDAESEILSRGQSRGDAEEIVDEAIVSVFTYAARYGLEKKIVDVKSFLIKTARHLLIDAWRKKRRADTLQTVSLDEADEELLNQAVDSSDESILQHIEANELAKIALRNATDEQLHLFRMWFIDEMTIEEIAARLNVTVPTVKNRMKRLLASLGSRGYEDSVRRVRLESHLTGHLTPETRPRKKPDRAKEAPPKLEEEFRNLVEQWHRETMHISSTTEMATNFAYQQIIGMGEKVLPLIFRELQETGGHWFWALRAITRQNPVPTETRGNINGMAQAWLE